MLTPSLDVPKSQALPPAEPVPTFLRLREVMRVTGLGRSTLYRMMSEHCFPAPCRLGTRAVGWRSDDITEWNRSRPTARVDSPPVNLGRAR